MIAEVAEKCDEHWENADYNHGAFDDLPLEPRLEFHELRDDLHGDDADDDDNNWNKILWINFSFFREKL